MAGSATVTTMPSSITSRSAAHSSASAADLLRRDSVMGSGFPRPAEGKRISTSGRARGGFTAPTYAG
jgi:hypothetical protein